jgi:DNA-binding CsgD family transcriptional regulator
MEMDHEAAPWTTPGEGGLRFASPGGGPLVQGAGPPGGELSLHTLTAALSRMMDVLPVEVVLCSPAGSILHANHPARERLNADGSRASIREEIRFLCVGLHLQIAEEEAGREETGPAFHQAERRVTLNGSELQLRAVDLGIPRAGGSPTTLVLLDARDHPLSDQDLEQEGLTRAEIRIARLVMRGGTNREIAGELSISVHTVRHHVQHILAKVGVRSRARLMEALHLLKVRPVAETASREGVADGGHRRG